MTHYAKPLNKAKILIITLIFLITSLFAGGGAAVARAANTANRVEVFEAQSILDDLSGATIAGKLFDIADYPANAEGDAQIISFVEFGYSVATSNQSDYGLYFYVYNPRGYAIEWQSQQNKIQLAFGSSDSAEYTKYEFKFLHSANGGLILKYRVELTSAQKQSALKKLSKQSRVYKVSGIELIARGEYTAREYTVGATFTYTGYAQGYGESSQTESTLNCKCEGLEIVKLDVNHTYYRTKTSNKGNDFQVQLDSVYFSVPNSLMKKYGSLQRIKAEWYEFKTKEIAVTNNKTVAEHLANYIGVKVGGTYNKGVYYGFMDGVSAYDFKDYLNNWFHPNLGGTYTFDGGKIFNSFTNKNDGTVPKVYYKDPNTSIIDALYYLFYTDVEQIMSYDPYGDITEQGGIPSNRLYDYIKEYSSKQGISSTLPIKDGRLAAELFEDEIDSDRVMDNEHGKIQKGYSYYDFDIDEDWQTIETYKPGDHNFTTNANIYGFWKTLFKDYGDNEQGANLPPIQLLDDSDIKATTDAELKAVSDKLYVNYNDIKSLQNFYRQAKAQDESVVLFRFATSDYYSAATEITMDKKPTATADNAIDGQAYIAQATCFFDFDIIQLAFKKGAELHVIPVVASPIDIIPDITPPTRMPEKALSDWWKYALTFTAVLVAFMITTTLIERYTQRRAKK